VSKDNHHLYPRSKFTLESDMEGVGFEFCSTLTNLKGSFFYYLFYFFTGFTYSFPFPYSLYTTGVKVLPGEMQLGLKALSWLAECKSCFFD
jgi:hypothetical protein